MVLQNDSESGIEVVLFLFDGSDKKRGVREKSIRCVSTLNTKHIANEEKCFCMLQQTAILHRVVCVPDRRPLS